MMLRISRARSRRGYTLIELLVVISIIGVLMGLLLSGVMAVLQAKDRMGNRWDVEKLDSSMKTAMGEYLGKPQTLPGKLVLCNNTTHYDTPPAGIGANTDPSLTDLARSKEALRKMFGNKLFGNGLTVYWNGDYTNNNTNNNAINVLQGQQCLVFYLGGISLSANGVVKMNGFSRNPTNPSDFSTREKFGPYYEFEPNRLVGGFGAGSGFYSYLDRYGTPFVYFGGTGASSSYVSYCPAMGQFCPNNAITGPTAYQEVSGKFTNASTFQIISAGKDKRFGMGSAWDPNNGSTDANPGMTWLISVRRRWAGRRDKV